MALLKTHAHAAPAPSLPRAPGQLLTLLRTGVTEAERRGAALELAGNPDVARELAACLAEETSPPVREAIVTALVGIGTEAAAAGLGEHVPGEDVALRNDAVEALRQMGESACSVVQRLLASPNPDVRIFALKTLESLRHADAATL
jgi:HEAT repeat protein